MSANEEPPPIEQDAPSRKPRPQARRRRPRRESALVWWGGFAVLLLLAWWVGSWRLALITLLLWCLYEFLLVPTICRVMTAKGFSCREPARGRLFACGASHQEIKNEALWRLVGLRNPFAKAAPPDAERDTGTLVVSPELRSRLAQADRALLILAAVGTLVTLAGMLLGL
ncbi:hypothetical protein [Spirillospora sp. CA-294931]|uniref:hypothetical protein n=1 Tax=Spirillospora sp. CA-294931 TaxID=3240042 RepID=UPI003D8F7E66